MGFLTRVGDRRYGRAVTRPKSARLMRTWASSQISPSPGADAAASKDRGRVRSRTVSAPVTATRWPDSRMPAAVKVMSGLLPSHIEQVTAAWTLFAG